MPTTKIRDTTIRVSASTRDRVRALSREGQAADSVIVAALDELERRLRRDQMRAESLDIRADDVDVAEVRQITDDLAPARAW